MYFLLSQKGLPILVASYTHTTREHNRCYYCHVCFKILHGDLLTLTPYNVSMTDVWSRDLRDICLIRFMNNRKP